MAATTPRLFFSSLVVFPYPFCFFVPLPFLLFSHFVVYLRFVSVSRVCVQLARGFLAPSFGFSRLLFALSASLFAFSSCGFLSNPFCFPALFVLLPFFF